MKKYTWYLILAFIAFLFSASWAFTRTAIWSDWNFSATGQIGDTIGGITGPIINLLGAILVFLSFREQQEANRLQNKALRKDRRKSEANDRYNRLVDLMEDLDITIESFEVTSAGPGSSTYVGIEAHRFFSTNAQHFANSSNKNPKFIVSNYINFLKLTLYIIDSIAAYDYNDPLTNEILNVKFINIIAQIELHLQQTKDTTAKINDRNSENNKIIHDYAEEILNQLERMKNSTTHFKP